MDKVTTIVIVVILLAVVFGIAVYWDQHYNQGQYTKWLEAGPPPEEPEPEPEPEMETVLAETRDAIQVLRDVVYQEEGEKRGGITPAEHTQLMRALADLKERYGQYASGQQAFDQVAEEVGDIALDARDQNRWRLVSVCVDVHDLLGIDSFTMDRLTERAEKNLGRPKVAVRGFLEDQKKDDLYVFLELTDRETGEVEKVTAREGEEIGDLRIIRIVGKNEKVVLEYLPIEGLFFEVEPFEEPPLKQQLRQRQRQQQQPAAAQG